MNPSPQNGVGRSSPDRSQSCSSAMRIASRAQSPNPKVATRPRPRQAHHYAGGTPGSDRVREAVVDAFIDLYQNPAGKVFVIDVVNDRLEFTRLCRRIWRKTLKYVTSDSHCETLDDQLYKKQGRRYSYEYLLALRQALRKISTEMPDLWSRKFRLVEDGSMPKSDHPGIRLRDRRAPTCRRAEDVLRRSIRFTLVPVAQGNGLQKFQAARRSYR